MSMQNSIRLLCLADIHLGCSSSAAMPEELDFTCFTPRKAWDEVVEYAISPKNGIDAILLAGDVVNQNDLFFETYHAFERGVRRLLEAGIHLIAVAGNHDASVFRKLVRTIASPRFHLLGQEGKWESVALTLKNRTIRFDGWSFPDDHVSYNPLDRYKKELADPDLHEIAIGLLHCDCPGTPLSPYAPVKIEDFRGLSPRAWVLGHSHKSVVFEHNPLIFYCGSLQGLDPGESGDHGAHLLDIYPDGKLQKTFISFAKVRWEKVTCSLAEVPLDDFEETLIQTLQTLHLSLKTESPFLYAVGCRLSLHGRTSAFKKIPSALEKLKKRIIFSQSNLSGKEVYYFIEKAENHTQPDYDLQHLAETADPAGLLAKHLIALQANGSETHQLCQNARQKLEATQKKYAQFTDVPVSDAKLLELMLQSGFYTLNLLLSQKDTSHEA